MPQRVGIGYDIHRMVAGRRLVLGGITIPHNRGLLGHSDGDVIVHAVCDAILGALNQGDIGQHFPDSSPETEDMYSLTMLQRIVARYDMEIVNIDVNCICEQPKLAPYRAAIGASLAGAAGIDPSRVSVKFRTNEGLDATGRGEAACAQAVVLIHLHAGQDPPGQGGTAEETG